MGIRISEMTTPMNSALTMHPASMDRGRPKRPFILPDKRHTHPTIRIFPIITQGIMAGMADMTGLPEMKKEVIGVMTDRMIPQESPAESPARIIQALMMGPVINTLVFLKNWLTMQIASSAAVAAICLVESFIIKSSCKLICFRLHGLGTDPFDSAKLPGERTDSVRGSTNNNGNDIQRFFAVGDADSSDDAVSIFMEQLIYLSCGIDILNENTDDGNSIFHIKTSY